ncbi:hypothetical protein K466DRAFT_660071 [Polyporus arcularius HHB13444]|uniref:Uncharacterized protein n=1 Tax=Polyporus arcularius HHB13444 TaxID=1314778 RepID=A0A5C3PS74_9APHY|nr:hypothetical protein K466DRAFT_660071 [Polyporus arcularius HHB13444]
MVQTRSSKNTNHIAITRSKSRCKPATSKPRTPPAPKKLRNCGGQSVAQKKRKATPAPGGRGPAFTYLKKLVPARDRKCFPLDRHFLRTTGQLDRWERFQSHPLVFRFDELSALCKLCYLNVQLCKRSPYDLEHWDVHCARCLRRDPRSASFKRDKQKNWENLSRQLQDWSKRQSVREKTIPRNVLQALREEYLAEEEQPKVPSQDECASPGLADCQDEKAVDFKMRSDHFLDDLSAPHDEVSSAGEAYHSTRLITPRIVHEDDVTTLLAEADDLCPETSRSLAAELDDQARRARLGAHRVPTHDELPAIEMLLALHSERRQPIEPVPADPGFKLSPVDWSTVHPATAYLDCESDDVV